MRFEILNVEHGFCAYAIGSDGGVLLYDCGHGSVNRPSTYLPDRGITNIRRFFVTNYDEDHISDLLAVRRNLHIEVLTRNASMTSSNIRSLRPGMEGHHRRDRHTGQRQHQSLCRHRHRCLNSMNEATAINAIRDSHPNSMGEDQVPYPANRVFRFYGVHARTFVRTSLSTESVATTRSVPSFSTVNTDSSSRGRTDFTTSIQEQVPQEVGSASSTFSVIRTPKAVSIQFGHPRISST